MAYAYSTKPGMENKPVNFVSWYDAARFTNWLHNGQGASDTETGAYTLLGGTPTPSNGLSITRNAGATWFLPSEDEWYKAAYYRPADDSYSVFPTGSNAVPTATAPPGGTNAANYWPGGQAPTDVGAYVDSASPNGTFDQGGNLWEWNESLIADGRGVRGGSFYYGSDMLHFGSRQSSGPDIAAFMGFDMGFRVAAIVVPEPTSLVLATIAFSLLLYRPLRRRLAR